MIDLGGCIARALGREVERLAPLGGGDVAEAFQVALAGGASWLIDPAAHGGHREFDLAMMRLFGGFDDACFAAYAEVAPLAPGWPERVPLHQLAPLVVHAIKFGGGYVGATLRALDALG